MAADAHRFAQAATGPDRVHRGLGRAHGHIGGAEEELQLGAAVVLDQRSKGLQRVLHVRLHLVTHQIRHGGLVVADLSAHLDADGFALAERRYLRRRRWRGAGTGTGDRAGAAALQVEVEQQQKEEAGLHFGPKSGSACSLPICKVRSWLERSEIGNLESGKVKTCSTVQVLRTGPLARTHSLLSSFSLLLLFLFWFSLLILCLLFPTLRFNLNSLHKTRTFPSAQARLAK